jgi:hypothetical protein
MDTVADVAAAFNDPQVITVIVDSLGGGSSLAYDGSGGSPGIVRVVSPPAEPGILAQQLLDDVDAVLANAHLVASGSTSTNVTVIRVLDDVGQE